MIITISGFPASGKTVVARLISQKLNMNHYSIGDIMRKIALDKGISIHDLMEIRKKDKNTDKMVDEYQEKLGKKEDNFVIDGRMSFHFIPNSFKVFFTVDLNVGAERLLKDKNRKGEKGYKTLKEAIESIKKRIEEDSKIYKRYYGIDYTSKSNYDLILDTTNLTIEEVADSVIKAIPRS